NIMSLGGIAIAIGAMVDAAIVLVENAHKHLETAPPGADRQQVLIAAAKEVGPPIFFSLLIITVAFLPIFGLNGQAGRLFKPPTRLASLSLLETVAKVNPREQWRMLDQPRWCSGWAPRCLKPVLRPLWPDRRRIGWQELTDELNRTVQLPGWTNAWTMPVK